MLAYLEAVTALGQQLLSVIAVGLGVSCGYFFEHYMRDPTVDASLAYSVRAPLTPQHDGRSDLSVDLQM